MKQLTKILVDAGLIVSLFITACNKNNRLESSPDTISNTAILSCNGIAYETMGGPANLHTLLGSRTYAMVHAAMHDALNATQPRVETYAFKGKDSEANPEAATASAAHHILQTLFPARIGFIDSAINNHLSTVQQNEAKTKGLALGIEAANAILSLNHNSNGAEDPFGQPAPATNYQSL